MNPEYPIFVPSKGRADKPYTIRALAALGVPFHVVIEEQEYPQYKEIVPAEQIIVLPHRDKGLTTTRNWIWDYAQHELKAPYFWTFDDNIRAFYRLHQNIKYYADCGTFLRVQEDFIDRYENVFITGMQYEKFAPRKKKLPPVIFNTRIYSNMLIRTDIPYRNELFYNDDTDLCLRVLKDGNCTALHYAFLAEKITTMTVKGGMTTLYEKTNSRREFAEELRRAHPDVVRVVWKFNRWHHEVNYKPFRGNKPIPRAGIEIPQEANNYGMTLERVEVASKWRA